MRSEYRRGILKFGIAAAMIAVAMVCRYLTKTEDLSDLVWNACRCFAPESTFR